MNCAETMEIAELYALDALTEEDVVSFKKHLEACEACRAKAGQLDAQIAQFRQSMRTPATQDPSLQKLRRRIRQEIWLSRIEARLRTSFPALGRAAAAIVICAGLLYAWHAVRNKEDGTCACKSWTQAGIAPVAGNNKAYPLVTDKEVFALTDEPDGKHLITMDRRTGSRLWKTPFPVAGLPCLDTKLIYAWGSADSSGLRLIALGRRTGRKVWIADDKSLPRQTRPAPIAASGQYLCWSSAGNVTALDVRTGKRVWTRTLSKDGSLSVPVANSKHLYVASGETLYALNMASGDICWRRDLERGSAFSPRPLVQYADGIVAVGCAAMPRRGLLQVFRAATGEALWRRETVAPQHLLAARGKIYVRGAGIQAFDGLTGNLAWSAPMGGCSPITIVADRVYVMEGLERKGIFAFQADTGQRVWAGQLMSSCSGFVIIGKAGYFVTQQGELRAVTIEEQPLHRKA